MLDTYLTNGKNTYSVSEMPLDDIKAILADFRLVKNPDMGLMHRLEIELIARNLT